MLLCQRITWIIHTQIRSNARVQTKKMLHQVPQWSLSIAQDKVASSVKTLARSCSRTHHFRKWFATNIAPTFWWCLDVVERNAASIAFPGAANNLSRNLCNTHATMKFRVPLCGSQINSTKCVGQHHQLVSSSVVFSFFLSVYCIFDVYLIAIGLETNSILYFNTMWNRRCRFMCQKQTTKNNDMQNNWHMALLKIVHRHLPTFRATSCVSNFVRCLKYLYFCLYIDENRDTNGSLLVTNYRYMTMFSLFGSDWRGSTWTNIYNDTSWLGHTVFDRARRTLSIADGGALIWWCLYQVRNRSLAPIAALSLSLCVCVREIWSTQMVFMRTIWSAARLFVRSL